MLAGLMARLYMNDYVHSIEFNKVILLKEQNDLIDVCAYECFQFGVGDVSGREKQELVRPMLQIKGVNKIGVFGYDNTVVRVCKLHDLIIVG